MDILNIKGISDKRAKQFAKLNITTIEELVKKFPRTYIDLTSQCKLSECEHNYNVLLQGKVENSPQVQYSYKRLSYVKIVASQGYQTFSVVWFNQPYVAKQLTVGKTYLFYGRVQNKYGVITLTNPMFELLDYNYRLKGIMPVYSLTNGLSQKVARDSIRDGITKLTFESAIPKNLQIKYDISSLQLAYKNVHKPMNFDEVKEGSKRIALEEFFTLISAFKIIKGDRQQVRINNYNCSLKELQQFINKFEFEFTAGQKQAVNDIYADLTSGGTMNRLLQGDVGCGKTAVSLCGIFMAVKSGYQATMLAPTEILAEQNYKLMQKYFSEYNVVFLSGSLTAKQKSDIKKLIKSGEAQIVVGTHAVIQKNVVFNNLSMCICDEQHRFGVAQRSSLLEKGIVPDLLVMSATPIPRTLSLIFYGDLDISTIPDKPKQRVTIQTNIVPQFKYEAMLNFIMEQIKIGRQIYFVCPKIEEDEDGTLLSVTQLYEEISQKFIGVNVGLLHGKMKDSQKQEIMEQFKQNKIKALVSTTVIEVGIDVPNASIMVIYNAERFGLSQLHQLRGRVGRSNLQSYCFLLSDSQKDKAIERLTVLKQNSDGFKIAEKDYELRGSGDFLGSRQSGKFFNQLGFLQYPTSVIFFAKKLSDEAFATTDNIENLITYAKNAYDKLKDITMN